MIIAELIDKLEELDRNAIVLIEDKNNWGKCEVDVIIDDMDFITLM